jgi:signal transduction histidine kinase
MAQLAHSNTWSSLLSFEPFAVQTQSAPETETQLSRSLTAELLNSQEKERRRIAGELHDSIGQSVGSLHFGIGVALELVRAGRISDAENLLSCLGGQAKQTIEEIRRIAMDLRPATLDDFGIVRTLSWFFREFHRVHPALTVSTNIAIKETDIPVTLATPIYRVIQESCNNVVRHSRASRLEVSLLRLTCSIQLRIEDNGQGLHEQDLIDTDHHGLGLRSMRNRVELSGGCFFLEGDTGNGTCIIANWPLSPHSCAMTASGKLCSTPY